MPVKSILLILRTKIENYLIEEARKNYTNDALYIISNMISQAIIKDNVKFDGWSTLYNKFKGKEIEDKRSAEQIETDTLNLFKNFYESEE